FLKALRNCPGFCCDPTVLKHELAPFIGTLRSSGASQEEPAATPELMATLAALRTELQVDSNCTTAARPAAHRAKLRRIPKLPVGPLEASDEVEPDAPRVFRRARNRPAEATSETVGLEAAHLHAAADEPAPRPVERTDGTGDPSHEDTASATATTRKRAPEAMDQRKRAPGRMRLRPHADGVHGIPKEIVDRPGLLLVLGVALVVAVSTSLGTAFLLGAFDGTPRVRPSIASPAGPSTTGRAE
ncbi:MAG: hypothetical protein KDK70_26800, partial [Myxococcales bacterium]|nr:hypothetical protein [Myxococcales bacterium]